MARNWGIRDIELAKFQVGKHNWGEQFLNAIYLLLVRLYFVKRRFCIKAGYAVEQQAFNLYLVVASTQHSAEPCFVLVLLKKKKDSLQASFLTNKLPKAV